MFMWSNPASSIKQKESPIARVNRKETQNMDLWTKTAEDFKQILNLSIWHKHKSSKIETFIIFWEMNVRVTC